MTQKEKRPGGRPPRAYHHGDLRNACIHAALELIEGNGVGGVTLRGVSERIGVSRSAPYRHFENKRDLLAACATHGFRLLEQAVKAAVNEAGDNPLDQFFAGSLAYAHFGAAHPRLYRLLFSNDIGESEYPELGKAGAAAFQVPVDLLEGAQRVGMVKRADPRLQAFALWSALHGVVNLHTDSRPTEVFDSEALEENVRGILAVLWEGLTSDTARRSPGAHAVTD